MACAGAWRPGQQPAWVGGVAGVRWGLGASQTLPRSSSASRLCGRSGWPVDRPHYPSKERTHHQQQIPRSLCRRRTALQAIAGDPREILRSQSSGCRKIVELPCREDGPVRKPRRDGGDDGQAHRRRPLSRTAQERRRDRRRELGSRPNLARLLTDTARRDADSSSHASCCRRGRRR
jgi:hypothetical protein